MLKGMSASPLESVLVSRHLSGKLPSMKAPSIKLPKAGGMEMQPKVKPLAHGFHNSFGLK